MKRTLILILLLVASVLGLLALSLDINKNKNEQTVVTTKPIAQTTLTLTTPKATGSAYTSDVVITTGGNKATAVQFTLSYNPGQLGYFRISKGKFFENGDELLNKIDTENGKISYALGVGLGQKGVQGTGIVATLTFQKLVSTGTAEIKFDPKSLVTAKDTDKSVLFKTTDIKFDLSQ